ATGGALTQLISIAWGIRWTQRVLRVTTITTSSSITVVGFRRWKISSDADSSDSKQLDELAISLEAPSLVCATGKIGTTAARKLRPHGPNPWVVRSNSATAQGSSVILGFDCIAHILQPTP